MIFVRAAHVDFTCSLFSMH